MSNQIPFPSQKFDVIYADPPWHYVSGHNRNGAAEKHYRTMKFSELVALPVSELAADNCALLMWTTGPMLDQSIELMEAWGFAYKTIFFNWVKTKRVCDANNDPQPQFGTGYYTRSSTEVCLIGVRGKVVSQLKCSSSVQQTILETPQRHSEKPDEAKRRIEEYFGSKTKKIELFARCAPFTPNWVTWGNESQ